MTEKGPHALTKHQQLLGVLLFCQAMDSQTLTLLLGSNRASYYRRRCIEAGEIQEITVKKRNRCLHTRRIYHLTRKGLQTLARSEPSASVIGEEDEPNVWLRPGNFCEDREEKLRSARLTAATVLAYVAGADIPLENFQVCAGECGEQQKFSTMDYIREALDENGYRNGGPFPEHGGGQTVFHSSRFVKACCGEVNSFSRASDAYIGRYSGIIDSPARCMMLFTAPMFGMSWNWICKKETAAYHSWMKIGRSGAACRESSAAMIVDSAAQFENLFRDTDSAGKSGGMNFGGEFEHFYILPLNRCGAAQLAMLMKGSDEELNCGYISDAVMSGQYTLRESSRNDFPLLDGEGNRTAVGFLLDAKRMLRIESMARMFPCERFFVLCYAWQREYYDYALPDNVFTVTVN